MANNLSYFKKIPKVNSPDHLDAVILSEARCLVPKKKNFIQPQWLPSLVTVSVICVVVVMVNPVWQNIEETRKVESTPIPGQMDREATVAEKMEMDVVVSDDLMAIESMAAKEEAEAVFKAAKEAPVISQSPVESAPQVSAFSESEVMKKQPGKAKKKKTASLSSNQQSEEKLLNQWGVSEVEIDAMLNEMYRLIKAGKKQQAQELLNKINRLCPSCDIPPEILDR